MSVGLKARNVRPSQRNGDSENLLLGYVHVRDRTARFSDTWGGGG